MYIKSGVAKIIKNSRKEKTIEISIKTQRGTFVASAPSGKSKGKNEVLDYNPRGINWSLRLANLFLKKIIKSNFIIKNMDDLKEVESKIKTFEKDFSELGGNITYAIETAILKAAAKENGLELWEFIFKKEPSTSKSRKVVNMPMPVGNCIGGGLHTEGIRGKKPDFQEFLLIPDEKSFSHAVTKNVLAYFYTKGLLKWRHRKMTLKKNDENAWNTKLTNEQVLDVLSTVAKKFNLRIGLDVAASSFLDDGGYYQYKNKILIREQIRANRLYENFDK